MNLTEAVIALVLVTLLIGCSDNSVDSEPEKLKAHSKEFLQLFESVALPVEETSFERRGRSLAIQ